LPKVPVGVVITKQFAKSASWGCNY